MIVVDASALFEALVGGSPPRSLSSRLFGPDQALHAPHLIDLEIANAMRRYVSIGQINATRARVAFEDLADLRLRRYPHDFLLPRIWELRNNLTAYDAAYIALAEFLGAPLLTCDERLARSPGHAARVELA